MTNKHRSLIARPLVRRLCCCSRRRRTTIVLLLAIATTVITFMHKVELTSKPTARKPNQSNALQQLGGNILGRDEECGYYTRPVVQLTATGRFHISWTTNCKFANSKLLIEDCSPKRAAPKTLHESRSGDADWETTLPGSDVTRYHYSTTLQLRSMAVAKLCFILRLKSAASSRGNEWLPILGSDEAESTVEVQLPCVDERDSHNSTTCPSWSGDHSETPLTTLIVVGSSDADGYQYNKVLKSAMLHKPNLFVHLGDVLTSQDIVSQIDNPQFSSGGVWDTQFFQPLEMVGLAKEAAVMYLRGDHDIGVERDLRLGNREFFRATSWGRILGGSFKVLVRIVALDSMLWEDEKKLDDHAEQLRWIAREFASNTFQTAKFRIAVMHSWPLFAHHSITNSDSIRNETVERLRLLFESSGISLVISGDSHNYQHISMGGIEYVCTGGGGAKLESLGELHGDGASENVSSMSHHALAIKVFHDRLQIEAKSVLGKLIDSFEIDHVDT